MYPHLGFYVCPSCGVCSDDICVIGYNESTVMNKKRKCIYKGKYFRSKIGKFSCREPLKIPDSVIQLIEGKLYNSDNMLACEQALGGMEGEKKEEGLYAHFKFYCSAPFLTFL